MEDWNWETIFYGHYRSIFNICLADGRLSWHSGVKTKAKKYHLSHLIIITY